jgi:hypothetical protein
VGGSEAKKGLGSDFLFRFFFIVFLNSPHRETPKNVIKQIRKYFYGVFELALPRNAQKRTKNKSRKKSWMVGGWV